MPDQEYRLEMRFKPTSEAHINFKELEALEKVLKEKEEVLKGRMLLWFTDNVTARAMVQRHGSQNIGPELWSLAKRVLDFALEKDIRLLPRYVPGRLNLAADQISRPEETFPYGKRPWQG